MTDVEERLRATLQSALDPVAADSSRATVTVRRARRGRALRGIATGMAGVLLAGAAALALERGPDERPTPANEPDQVATFRLDFGDAGDGVLTIDVPKAQACIDLSHDLSARIPQLRFGDEVVEYLPVGRAPRCKPVDPSQAARVLAKPERHFVWLDGGDDVRSPLEPLDLAPERSPDVAEIVCSQDGAVAVTPQVQAREDGVHLRFYFDTGRWTSFNLVNDSGENEGGDLRESGFEDVSGFRPGPLYAGCFERLNDAPSSTRDPAYTKLTVVDPRGLWSDYEPDCSSPYLARTVVTDEAPQDSNLDFEAMTREHVSGLAPDDVLDRPRYPESEHVFETRMVVRDGRRVASVMFVPFRGIGFSVDVRACPGSGIAWDERV